MHSEMKRSEEISEIVAESRRILQKGCKPRKEPTERELALTSLLQKAVELLYSHPYYVDHLKHDLADDFANLPTEIVHDVVELASFEDEKLVTVFENKKYLETLALIDGSWADFGNEFATTACLRKTTVDSRTDLDELKASASQLCGDIRFIHAPNQFYEILELMGTRFSSIEWYAVNNLNELASLQMTRFLKRQLNSKFLRKLFIDAEVASEVSDLFVEFVKKPHFEKLRVGRNNLLTFEVIEEAHKSWESQVPRNSPLEDKEIYAPISHKTAKKLKDHFKVTENRVHVKHPVHGEAEMHLQLFSPYATRYEYHFNVRMTVGSLAERSGYWD